MVNKLARRVAGEWLLLLTRILRFSLDNRPYKTHRQEQKKFLVKFHLYGYVAFILGCGLFFLLFGAR